MLVFKIFSCPPISPQGPEIRSEYSTNERISNEVKTNKFNIIIVDLIKVIHTEITDLKNDFIPVERILILKSILILSLTICRSKILSSKMLYFLWLDSEPWKRVRSPNIQQI